MIPKEFMTLFDSLSRSHGSEVFRDFLDVLLFVLSCGNTERIMRGLTDCMMNRRIEYSCGWCRWWPTILKGSVT